MRSITKEHCCKPLLFDSKRSAFRQHIPEFVMKIGPCGQLHKKIITYSFNKSDFFYTTLHIQDLLKVLKNLLNITVCIMYNFV